MSFEPSKCPGCFGGCDNRPISFDPRRDRPIFELKIGRFLFFIISFTYFSIRNYRALPACFY
ncbi:hypothetical protein CKA32_005952 [Geitlerinema sp. FC II]|nr:hypothetical protein CKA32_005952 [Geitlerinema sp. FC II]